ncbi:MAG: cytochrome b, partial [Rhodospirillales bacterium]|nr:cytochrome b [Rhodospirillales bacterium]
FFWIFLADCVLLGVVGGNPAEGAWIWIGQIATAYYFAHFLVIIPLIGMFERPKELPSSISDAVLKPSQSAMGAAE